MNASFQTPASQPSRRAARTPAPMREHRGREFGVGYGSSSGYARRGSYAPSGPAARFRVS